MNVQQGSVTRPEHCCAEVMLSKSFADHFSLPLQPVFAPMLQSNPRMLTSGSHPPAIVSSSGPQFPSEQPTPQALYGEFWTLSLQAVLPSPLQCAQH